MEKIKHLSEKLNLKLYILKGKNKDQELQDIYLQTYICWRKVWEDVYKAEMHQDHNFYSDDFQRQDQIVALFADDQCVGMAFMRHIDFNSIVVQTDSCFRFWPEESLRKISNISKDVTIASYFTLGHDFRRIKFGVCWKTLLLSLFVKCFQNTNSQIMVTAARKMKSNEKLCYKVGAKPIMTSIPYWIENGKQVNEETVDILFWNKNKIILEDPFLQELSTKVWNSRLDLTTNTEKKEVAHAS